MKALDIELFRYRNIVFGRVLEQNISARFPSDASVVLQTRWEDRPPYGVFVTIISHPHLGTVGFGLGARADNTILFRWYGSVREAIQFSKKMMDHVRRINNGERTL